MQTREPWHVIVAATRCAQEDAQAAGGARTRGRGLPRPPPAKVLSHLPARHAAPGPGQAACEKAELQPWSLVHGIFVQREGSRHSCGSLQIGRRMAHC